MIGWLLLDLLLETVAWVSNAAALKVLLHHHVRFFRLLRLVLVTTALSHIPQVARPEGPTEASNRSPPRAPPRRGWHRPGDRVHQLSHRPECAADRRTRHHHSPCRPAPCLRRHGASCPGGIPPLRVRSRARLGLGRRLKRASGPGGGLLEDQRDGLSSAGWRGQAARGNAR